MEPINTGKTVNYSNSISPYSNVSTVNSLQRDAQQAFNKSATNQHAKQLKGEILDIKNNEVTVLLEDNTKLTAKVTDTSNLNIGQLIKFKVNYTNNGLVMENIQTQDSFATSIIYKALEAANLPATDRNINIVTELLKHNMSLDKSSIINIQKQSIINSSVSISTIVLMNKNKIPFTQENVQQFENYCNYEHRIIKELNNISNEVPDILTSIANDPSRDVNALKDFNSQLTAIINGQQMTSSYKEEPIVASAYLYPDAARDVAETLQEFNADKTLIDGAKSGMASLRDVATAILKGIEEMEEIDGYQLDNRMSFTGYSSGNTPKSYLDSPAINNILDKFSSLQRDTSEIASFMSKFNRAALTSKLRDIKGSEPLTDSIWKGDITASDLLTGIDRLLADSSDKATTALLTSSQYKTIVKEALLNQWTISPQDLTKEKSIEKIYKRIYSQLDTLQELASSNKENVSSSLDRNFSGTKSNIDFMNTLNEMLTYVQLPIKLRDKNIHSDLYVMTNKKKLSRDNANINVLLHLDMDYLGSMDINIDLRGNNINAKFNVTDEDTKDLLEINMEQLEFALLEKGFLMNSYVSMQEETVDLVKDFLDVDTAATSLKRYTFDIRA